MLNHKFWRNLIICAWGASPGLSAQTAELPFFLSYLRSPAQTENWVVADLRVHVLRDARGAIDSGGSCVRLRWNLRDQATLTALRIHRASDGGVTLQATFPSTVMRGAGSAMAAINDKIRVQRGDRQALEDFARFLEDPYGHYITLATREQPDGAFRGPIWKNDYTVLMSVATADPAIPAGRRPWATLGAEVFLARDRSGTAVFGELLLGGYYHYPEQVTFTGLRIRAGADGTGPAVISPPVTSTASSATGAGNFGASFLQVRSDEEPAFQALQEVARAPENFSVSLETGTQPQSTVRGRLRRTDRVTFQLQFDARNVVPPPSNWEGRETWSTSIHELFTLRREEASIAAVRLSLEGMFRFPEPCELRSILIRKGRAGVNGPVAWTWTTTPAALTAGHWDGAGFQTDRFDEGDLNNLVNDLVERPEEYYMEVTTDKGAVRAQYSTMTQLPVIEAVVSANLDPASRIQAPGALVSIWGRNLAKAGSDLSGWEGQVIPEALNGVAVGAGPHRARLLYVSPAQINVQLPFELPAGAPQVAVNNSNGLSNVVTIQVAAAAPAIFPGAILKRANNSLVTAGNPAQSGDVLVVFLTGLGQTTPALVTGRLVDAARAFSTVPVTATIGGKDAEVLSSTAAPGWPGVYQVVLRVPAGVAPGNLPLVLKAGAASSNTVSVALR